MLLEGLLALEMITHNYVYIAFIQRKCSLKQKREICWFSYYFTYMHVKVIFYFNFYVLLLLKWNGKRINYHA